MPPKAKEMKCRKKQKKMTGAQMVNLQEEGYSCVKIADCICIPKSTCCDIVNAIKNRSMRVLLPILPLFPAVGVLKSPSTGGTDILSI